MANRYWVGGGSSTAWNATGNTNWSASSGGANNASVPGSTDDVFFDAISGSGTANISASISVSSVDCTGYTGTWTQANSTTLTITGNSGVSFLFKLSSGMTYAPSAASQAVAIGGSSAVTFPITSAGHTIGNFTMNPTSGATTQLQDALALRSDATLTLTQGTFDANTYSVTAGLFSSSGINLRTITMGNGLWTLNGGCANSTIWNTGTTTNLTFNKGTSNLVFSFCNSFQGLRTFASGGLTFNDVTFNSTAASPATLTWTGSPTIATAKFYGPLVVLGQSGNIAMNATQFTFDTTSGPLALIGQGASSQYMYFSQASGTITMDKVSLYDTNWSAAGSPTVTATNSYDLGGNVGITITAPSAGAVAANPLGGFVGK